MCVVCDELDSSANNINKLMDKACVVSSKNNYA